VGVIYLVRNGESGLIKIGHTVKGVRSRVSGMQSGNPETLHLLATMPGDRQMEQDLHDLFRGRCVVREWFMPCPELLWFADELSRDADGLRHPEPVRGLRARIYELGRAMVARMRDAQSEPWLTDWLMNDGEYRQPQANKSTHAEQGSRRARAG